MVYLVVPCFNEEKRLPVLKFQEFHRESKDWCSFLFVNDGSRDGTSKLLEELKRQGIGEVLSLPQNMGKAEAVRKGIQHLLKTREMTEADWIGFWDADLATPLWEVPNFLKYANFYSDRQIDAIWGSRVYRLGAHIERSHLRHYIGRGFATLVDLLFGLDTYDSQCGAKLFRPKAAELATHEIFVSRWIFDVEIYLRLEKFQIIEYSLCEWVDVAGSKITIKEFWRVAQDIFFVYRAYRSSV